MFRAFAWMFGLGTWMFSAFAWMFGLETWMFRLFAWMFGLGTSLIRLELSLIRLELSLIRDGTSLFCGPERPLLRHGSFILRHRRPVSVTSRFCPVKISHLFL
jgi:hypothetical protein